MELVEGGRDRRLPDGDGYGIVCELVDMPAGITLYARVSSADQMQNLERQFEHLQSYAIAKGYTVRRVVTEVASE
jgi:predicted site-specific integrase-resolvase